MERSPVRKYDLPRQHRREAQVILMIITLALVAGRIATVTSREGDTAFQSANDRSRWATISALVEDGTFAIDRQIAIRSEDGRRRPWDTIDKVRHLGEDGELHFYSSKPTLMTTILAGVYWPIYRATGLRLTEHPIYLPRLLLLLINIPVLAVFLGAMLLVVELVGVSDYARRFTFAAACFGTLLTPFSITLSNHLFAAASVAVVLAIYLWVAEKYQDDILGGSYNPRFWPWFVSGIFAALSVANELPALSMLVCWLVLFAWLSVRSIVPFLIGAGVVAAGAFATNWIAHESWRTPYAHRSAGAIVETVRWDQQNDAQWIAALRETPTLELARSIEVRELFDGGYEIDAVVPAGDWAAPEQRREMYRFDVVEAGKGRLAIWDDWYDYPGSYWREDKRRGVDLGEPNRWIYLFHATLGVYGIFSLTPLWLLILPGFVSGIMHGPNHIRRLVAAIGLCTVVCIAFYVSRGQIDRNYGGVSIGFRWMTWFVPLWLPCVMSEVSDLSETRAGRVFASLLMAASVFTVATSLDSPWQSPWIMRFATFLGWMGG